MFKISRESASSDTARASDIAPTRARLLESSRFHHLCRFILEKVKSSTSSLTRSF